MFDLAYFKYIFDILKNTICPNIDNTFYNPHIEHLINKKSVNKISDKNIVNNDLTILFLSSYKYLNIYVNDYIKYFCIDTSLYMRLNKYYRVVNT